MPPKLTLGIIPLQQSSVVQQVTQVQKVACVQELACECSLCKQTVLAHRQLQFELIDIEGYSMCPSCCQRVRKEIAVASWYRKSWNRRIKAIKDKRNQQST
jgi:uncharacterized protein (UPF0212 family)